jgi:hypothetical protein
MDKRHIGRMAAFGEYGGAYFVSVPCLFDLGFGEVHFGVGGRIDCKGRPVLCKRGRYCGGVGDIDFGVSQGSKRDAARRGQAHEFLRKLTTAAKEQYQATTPSRSPR